MCGANQVLQQRVAEELLRACRRGGGGSLHGEHAATVTWGQRKPRCARAAVPGSHVASDAGSRARVHALLHQRCATPGVLVLVAARFCARITGEQGSHYRPSRSRRRARSDHALPGARWPRPPLTRVDRTACPHACTCPCAAAGSIHLQHRLRELLSSSPPPPPVRGYCMALTMPARRRRVGHATRLAP